MCKTQCDDAWNVLSEMEGCVRLGRKARVDRKVFGGIRA